MTHGDLAAGNERSGGPFGAPPAPPATGNGTAETDRHKTVGPWRLGWRRFRRNRMAVAGLILFVAIVLAAVFAASVAPHDPLARDLRARMIPPGDASYLLGTDYLGRDILSRLIHGAQISLQVGLISVGLALSVGTTIGALAAYKGGWADLLLMRVMDVMLAFPSILLAIGIMAILGPSLQNAMIAIGIVGIPTFARIVRGSVLSLKEKEFVEAAHAIGLPDWRIVIRHVLPNCVAPLIVQGTLSVATAILDAAGLSFLGLGAQPPTPEWGAMLSDARPYLRTAPWMVTFPGVAIVVAVMSLNLLGDGLRDAFDPKMQD